ncbi:translocation/assembly module TamB domain-containing protein [Prevotella sp. 10(H)]|uniref:translocation/assembly module TamB domain-containing protein n=1 Tax=Prevotella sp. 10(H) TaxID=1158294 RepID=UPI0004A706FC|nr:translocation/assembly module TamB domain-containing protein [Prevotella sp. 10(H)]
MAEAENTKTTPEETPVKKKSLLKKFFKIIMYIVLSLIGLNVLLYVLLSIPYIQQKVANFAVDKLKTAMHTEVSIDEIRLSLFNNVKLKGIYVEDQAKDTLLYAKSLDVSINPLKLIKSSTVQITSVDLEDFLINVNQKDSISDFNFQFIVDAFASTDSAAVDTTGGSLIIVIEDLNLKNGRLNYDVLSAPYTPGMFNASHISLYDFNGNADLNSINPDKFDIALNGLSAKERSGVEIKDLKGHLFSEKSQLWVDDFSLTLPDSHLITTKARYNLASGAFELGTDDTELSAADLLAFLPNLKFLRNKVVLRTNIAGTLPAVNVQNITLTYGEDLILEGGAGLASYESYGTSDINLNIDKFKATTNAITDFARVGDSTFVTPDILKELGDIFLKGTLTGQLSRFKLDAEAWCRQGALTMLATGGVDTTFTNFNVTAGLRTNNFNLGRLLGGTSGLGLLSAHVDVKAAQTEKQSLNAVMRGNIDALQYEKETMKNVPFTGFYNASKMGLTAKADWSIGKIQLAADMSQARVPDINVRLRLDTVHVDKFYKNPDWTNPRLTMALNGSVKGLDIDNMTGKVVIDSLSFRDSTTLFQPGKFTLEMGKKETGDKFIALNSSIITANIEGQYSFTTLSDEFTNLMNGYLPAVFVETKRIRKEQNNFTFNITAKNTGEVSRIFALPVDIMQPAIINGQVNTIDNLITVKGNIPHIRYSGWDVTNTTIDIANRDSAFNITAGSGVLMSEGRYKLALNLDGANNIIHTKVNVIGDSTEVKINGTLDAIAQFSRNEARELVSSLKVSPSDIMVDRLALNLLPAEIINEGKRTEVHNVGLGVNKKKYFGFDGVVSDQKTDTLRAYFDHAEIGDLLEAFDVKNIRGELDGNILLTNLLDQPELYTKGFRISDIILFSDTLGTLDLESQWSDEYGGATMAATLQNKGQTYADLDGTIYTNQDSLDLQLRMQQMPLRWMQPFFSGMLNKVDGSLSTNLIVEGSMKAPQVRGFIGFNDTQIGIDYTNVTYTISDTIRVSPDRIGLDNLTLRDNEGNTAQVSATVTHKNFADMHYALNMQMNKLMVLNTEHRTDSLFYGRVYASGSVRVDGSDNGINVNMQIKNDKNSTLNILIPQHSEASDYKSVVYINVPEEKRNPLKEMAPREEPLPIKLNVKLDVTPDLNIGIVINPQTGDALQAKGAGTINFNYDMVTENMGAYGNYTLNEGNVRLNLQNVKRLNFTIREGSKLNFIGDPMKTQFDITAFRRVKADLKTLDSSFGMGDISSKVQVDCVLGITGNMDKMELTYDISLPDANEDLQQRVNSYISTDEQKIRQFAYLVAVGSFYSSSGSSGVNFGDGLWTNIAASAMSSVLNMMVGNILGDKWQIGASVESNDGTFNDLDLGVNVSRKFLDDKLTFRTNLGYRTDQSATNDNAFIGDFDLEYQLNSVWTLKAYSHTNDKYYRQAPTTQGVGIVYSKEAATLKRLFQSFRPRRFRRNQNQASDSIQTNGQQSNRNQRRNQNGDQPQPAQPEINPAPQQTVPVQPSDSTQANVNKQPAINDQRKK